MDPVDPDPGSSENRVIALNQNQLTLASGSSSTLSAAILPAVEGARITWTSSDPDAAAVSPTGLVTNLHAGFSDKPVTVRVHRVNGVHRINRVHRINGVCRVHRVYRKGGGELQHLQPLGLAAGVGDGQFAPGANITREQAFTLFRAFLPINGVCRVHRVYRKGGGELQHLAEHHRHLRDFMVMLHAAMGKPAPSGSCTFTDASPSSYYYSALSWAQPLGWRLGWSWTGRRRTP